MAATAIELQRADIIGVPMDLGASRRGVDMGPYAVRYAKLNDKLRRLGIDRVFDRGNLNVPTRESLEPGGEQAKYYDAIEQVCSDLCRAVEHSISSGGFPIVIGGDHSIAMGTLAGLTAARGVPPGLLWFDAHSDFNSPETSPSGNVHGMPLWFILQNGYADAARTVQIGLRDVDPEEKRHLREFGVTVFTIADIDRLGITAVMEQAIRITGEGECPIHLSFDMDAVDPAEAPGTGTPVKGGLSYREAHLAMEMVATSARLGSIEMVEINPILDVKNQTALLAVDLVCSALGKTIL